VGAGTDGANRSAGNETRHSPKDYKPTPSPSSPAILVGHTLYMSGATGGNPATGQLVTGGFEPEMRQIMTNLETVLRAANLRGVGDVGGSAKMTDANRGQRCAGSAIACRAAALLVTLCAEG